MSIESDIRDLLYNSGAAAVGFAEAEPVDLSQADSYRQWISQGANASMSYLERHEALRLNPQKILPDTVSIISVAFPYLPKSKRPENAPQVALYASGRDYHKALVRLIRPVCRYINNLGHSTRICIDSAPIPERYWALKAGIGLRGDNGTVIIPKYGSYIFLAEILTSLPLTPDAPSRGECFHCGACVKACPGGAIRPDGSIDANRCLSYLTIEHRSPYTAVQREILNTPEGRNTLFGCDICQRVCPHNRDAEPTEIPAFQPSQTWLTLDFDTIRGLVSGTGDEGMSEIEARWNKLTLSSPIRRASLENLLSRVFPAELTATDIK